MKTLTLNFINPSINSIDTLLWLRTLPPETLLSLQIHWAIISPLICIPPDHTFLDHNFGKLPAHPLADPIEERIGRDPTYQNPREILAIPMPVGPKDPIGDFPKPVLPVGPPVLIQTLGPIIFPPILIDRLNWVWGQNLLDPLVAPENLTRNWKFTKFVSIVQIFFFILPFGI